MAEERTKDGCPNGDGVYSQYAVPEWKLEIAERLEGNICCSERDSQSEKDFIGLDVMVNALLPR